MELLKAGNDRGDGGMRGSGVNPENRNMEPET